jgi:hypothetical protein
MPASNLPNDLARARSRLRAWRNQRRRGQRIPEALWARAVRLAMKHGINRTAAALALDYYSLKQRTEEAADRSPSSRPAFVEVSAPIVAGKQGLFELDNGAGATLRVQLVGYDATDIEALTRRFWNAD